MCTGEDGFDLRHRFSVRRVEGEAVRRCWCTSICAVFSDRLCASRWTDVGAFKRHRHLSRRDEAGSPAELASESRPQRETVDPPIGGQKPTYEELDPRSTIYGANFADVGQGGVGLVGGGVSDI